MPPRAIATSIIILALGFALAAKGFDLLRFESAEAEALSLSGELAHRPAERAGREDRIARMQSQLQAWTSSQGVQVRARNAIGLLAAAAGDPARIENAVINFLMVEPTAGAQWLELARLRWSRNAAVGDVFAALQMSRLSEPLEANTMNHRTPFLLRLWELLPMDEQNFTVNQLVELNGRFDEPTLKDLRSALSSKPASVREQIKSRLRARVSGEQSWWSDVGL